MAVQLGRNVQLRGSARICCDLSRSVIQQDIFKVATGMGFALSQRSHKEQALQNKNQRQQNRELFHTSASFQNF